MPDFGKQGGRAPAPVRGPIQGGTPSNHGNQSAPKSTPTNPTSGPGGKNSRRGWK